MYREDARKLPPDALEALRRRAIAAVESGLSRAEVARRLGVSRQTISGWHRDYRTGGEEALRCKRRGRRPGDQLALSYAQQLWTIRTVTTCGPDQVGLRYWLWTNQALAELVNSRFRIALSVTTVRNYLIRWGVLSEPLLFDRARERRVAAVTSRPSPAAGGETLWTSREQTRWLTGSPPDREPVTRPGFARDETSMLYAVSNRGTVFFLPSGDPMDGLGLAEFFTRLLRQRGRRINIEQGWRPAHRAEALDAWLVRYADLVSVRFSGDAVADVPPPGRATVPEPPTRARRAESTAEHLSAGTGPCSRGSRAEVVGRASPDAPTHEERIPARPFSSVTSGE